jgi:hypothetical protein
VTEYHRLVISKQFRSLLVYFYGTELGTQVLHLLGRRSALYHLSHSTSLTTEVSLAYGSGQFTPEGLYLVKDFLLHLNIAEGIAWRRQRKEVGRAHPDV